MAGPAIAQEGQDALSSIAQDGEDALSSNSQGNKDSGSQKKLRWNSPLVLVEFAWLVLIGIGAPWYSSCVGKRINNDASKLRGLNMPSGSLRGMLALLVVGSFVNVLVLGGPELGNSFEIVVSAFGALTGSIIGFYFGSRNATPPPSPSP